jgi:hypothetical protein
MVRKRAKLKGQGKEAFFSDTETQADKGEMRSPDEKKKLTASGKKKSTLATVPPDFREKVQALKQMIRQFKALVEPEEFNKLTGRDLE